MQTIRCAACGRRYDYRQEGCCPRCGAYNRPPRREWVEADGSIHHVKEEPGKDRARPGKVCYEEKACFEEKQCYEEQTRKTRKKRETRSTPGGERVVWSVQKQFSHSKGGAQKSGVGVIVTVIVLVVAVLLIRSVVLGNNHWQGGWAPTDEPDIGIYEETIKGDCGETIRIRKDLSIQFLGYTSDEEGRVYLFYYTEEPDAAMELLESGFVALEDQDGMYSFSNEVGDGYIVFDPYDPDASWQTLYIDSNEGEEIIIRNLMPVLGDG